MKAKLRPLAIGRAQVGAILKCLRARVVHVLIQVVLDVAQPGPARGEYTACQPVPAMSCTAGIDHRL